MVITYTGYKAPSVDAEQDTATVVNASTATAESVNSTEKINEVDAVNMAVSVATNTNLAVTESVSSQSISISTMAELDQSNSTTAAKPQITDNSLSTEAFVSYVATDGDTATSIASKYGLSDQTIRWANDLNDDTVLVGAVMIIPVVDGVVYDAKSGDALTTIAEKYGSSVDQIISINNLDADATAIDADYKLLLPSGTLPENERPGYTASRATTATTATTNFVPYANGNTYAYGYCTWYAFNRRTQLGLPIPSNLGNANTWDNRAAAAGYRVDRIPEAGAVFQTDAGTYGHVGVVERVNADGTIEISEMNNRAYGGWGKTNTRTITNPGDYKYIH